MLGRVECSSRATQLVKLRRTLRVDTMARRITSKAAACAAVLALLCTGAAAQGVKPVSGDVKPKGLCAYRVFRAHAAGTDTVLVSPPSAAPPYTDVSFPLEHSLGAQEPFKTAGTFTARAYFDKSGSVRSRAQPRRRPPEVGPPLSHPCRSPHHQGAVKLTHLKLERLPGSKEDECVAPLRCCESSPLLKHLSSPRAQGRLLEAPGRQLAVPRPRAWPGAAPRDGG